MVEQKLKTVEIKIPEGSIFLVICETEDDIILNGTITEWAEMEVIMEMLERLGSIKKEYPDINFPEDFINSLCEFLFTAI